MQAGVLKNVLPSGVAQKTATNWSSWPLAMLPLAVIGLVMATRVWNAKPSKAGGGH